jgi:nucleoside-diphosphate-sugar epimerase
LRELAAGRTAIIFGGAGFIGTHLLRSLITTGRFEKVFSADLHLPADRVAGVEYMTCDVREPIELKGDFKGSEVYNLAAVHTTPGHDDWEYFWTNVSGAAHVCAFAEQVGCKTLVFTSSISTYGSCEDLRDESGPMSPDNAYGRSKLQAEKIHRLWQRGDSSRQLVVVRPAVVFGAGENGNFTRLADLLRRDRFSYPGRRDTVKACGYVGELIRTIEFALTLNQPELTYNFAYPQRYTTQDICAAFNEVAGYKLPRFTIPLWLMLCGGFVFEILARFGLKTSINRTRVLKLVNSTNIVPSTLVSLGYCFETDLREGLSRWYKDKPQGEFV